MTLWTELATTRVMADINGTWTDISSYVLLPGRGQQIAGRIGRATELSKIDPTTLTLVLNNADGRFTPGNTAGAYYPYWTTGTRIRWTETLGPWTYRFPDMWLEIGEVALTYEGEGQPTLSDRVTAVQCVDLLTRLNRAPRFCGTLAEWIKYNQEPTEYWPLSEAEGARKVRSLSSPTSTLEVGTVLGTASASGLLTFGSTSVYGDDTTSALFVPSPANGTYSYLSGATGATVGVSQAATATLSVSAWVRLSSFPTVTGARYRVMRLDSSTLANTQFLVLELDSTTFAWYAEFSSGVGGDLTGSVTATFGTETDVWCLATVVLDVGTNDITIYVNGETETANLTESGIFVSTSFNEIAIGAGWLGNLNHVQIHSPGLTQEQHLAQWDAGRHGLVGQTVDERIRTVCNYAGVTDAQLDLEPSHAIMQGVSLLDQRPGEVASAASVTGGGILYTHEARLVYHDRRHRFDQ